MIIYTNTVVGFRDDVDLNQLVPKLKETFKRRLGFVPGDSETRAWLNSLRFMESILRRSGIPNDCGVLVEYVLPASSKRIDFLVTGIDQGGQQNAVIVELKQWQDAQLTTQPDIVMTYLGGSRRNVAHPSYQAWSYREFMAHLNSSILGLGIKLSSCAYLHNYEPKEVEPLLDTRYAIVLKESPLFFAQDTMKLQDYFVNRVNLGRGLPIVQAIESGKLVPSPKLVESLVTMFRDNKNDFMLLDEQKVALEAILEAVGSIRTRNSERRVVIIRGGPGTGKSVIAMSAFVSLIKDPRFTGGNVRFVAPNASFREVLVTTLAKGSNMPKGIVETIKQLFVGSAGFVETETLSLDAVIVDEAHRLKGKGAYQYKGVNQIEDIIRTTRVSIFFVDDEQKIRPVDIGSVDEIKRIAHKHGADCQLLDLVSQFRCVGAEGYLNWMDTVLQLNENANYDGWDEDAFLFKIYDTPQEVVNAIMEHDRRGARARVLAGYAWPWKGEKDGKLKEVSIHEHGFAMPWNSQKVKTWAVNPDGLAQIGCVPTSQGLEFDHVGVLIGNDLRYDSASGRFIAEWQDYHDSEGKKGLKEKPEDMELFIRRIYKVLLSRGQKGCHVYIRDPGLRSHFEARLSARTKSFVGVG